MKNTLVILIITFTSLAYSQGNCLLYPEGSDARKACRLAQTTGELTQGSRESQIRFDSIIALNPNYAWAYFEKSVAYLKRGLIIKGLQLLDKAVELDPKSHLCYRAYWYFQNRNYDMCIKDLERYYAIPNAYIYELTPGGDKDMRILLGMSYAKKGNIKKGIKTIENCIMSYRDESDIGYTDYHILGLLYLKDGNPEKALEIFQKQLKMTEDFPDTYYYQGLAYLKLNQPKKTKLALEKALSTFKNPNRMGNGYYCFRAYPKDVKDVLKKSALNRK